jgi:S1-C subfamily serine protease
MACNAAAGFRIRRSRSVHIRRTSVNTSTGEPQNSESDFSADKTLGKERLMIRSRFRRWATLVLLTALAMHTARAVAADVLTKAEVGKLGKAATVFVKGTKSSGSGFCINASGLLITNEHVVSGEKEVTVVFNPSAKEQKVLPAKVLRADKKRDLALLQVEGPQELPILPLGSSDQLSELSDVVICGFPLGEILSARKEYPAISINAGSITALRRQADALEFLQLDGAVNPGNSGGPVIDMGGKVVGVVVGRIRGGEQLNFAIPVEHVAEFVKRPEILLNIPVLSQSQAHEPAEFEARVAYVFPPLRPPTLELVLRTNDGPDRRTNLALKDGAYRTTIVPVPRAGFPVVEVFARFKTGAILGIIDDREFQVGEQKVKFSACQQIQLQPQSSVLLTNGKTLRGELTGINMVAIAVAGKKLDVDLGTATSVQISLPDPVAEVECTWIARQDDVEVARLETRIPLGSSGLIVRSGPRQLPIEPPRLAAAKVLKSLPEIASDICVGGGGRYLVLNLPKLKKLAIFDVNEAAITHYIPLTDHKVVFAAGLEKVVLGVTAKGILERWDLQTGEKEISRPMPELADLTSIVIGSASTNHVVANGVFLDLQTLKPMPIKTPRGSAASGNPVSADGTVFGGWKTNQSPDESISFVLEGDELKRYEEGGLKHVVPGPDGRTLCTGRGVQTVQLKPWGGGPSKAGYCLPATEGNFILSVTSAEGKKSGSIALYLLNHEEPIVKDVGVAHDIRFDGWDRNPFGPWKRIFFIPRAELIVIFPESNDRLELHHFDLNEALDNSGLDYLLVTSQPPTTARRGTEFRYQVVVKSRKEGVKYQVNSGPPGLEVSPTGLVKWQVPANDGEAGSDVIVTIRDASGQEVFHTFSLKRVSGSEPAGAPN